MKVIYNMVVYDDKGRERLRESLGCIEPEKVFTNEVMTEYEVRLRFAIANIENIRHTMEVNNDNKM